MYEQALRKDKNVEELNLLTQTIVSNEMIDKGISKMNTILLNAAKKAFFVKTVKNKKTHKKRHTQDWFTRECKARQNIFRQYSKDIGQPF